MSVANNDGDDKAQQTGEVKNENIESLKKLRKTPRCFDQIYAVFTKIANELDTDAISYAIKEKFTKVTNGEGKNVICNCCSQGDIMVFKMLWECIGISEYQQLLYFSMNGKQDFIRYLIKFPEIPLKYYDDYLLYASRCGYFDIVKLILPKCNIKVRDHLNRTVLMNALMGRNTDLIRLLLEYPGIELFAKDSNNNTTLMYASKYGSHEAVSDLLKHPVVDVNAKNDHFNDTALHEASRTGHHEVVKLLLTVPMININAKNESGMTSLMCASISGFYECVNLLLKFPGIDINAEDNGKYTALYYAKTNGNPKLIELLKSHGAKTNGNPELIEVLNDVYSSKK